MSFDEKSPNFIYIFAFWVGYDGVGAIQMYDEKK